ncbi:MAG TPA: cache domain-containing protein [Devosia sp.]|nr:cache domain-containing protein [Devosia sp.]
MQLIVRNLYERTADVRWWATDPSIWQALYDPNPHNLALATQRLRVIHRYYTVYSDLVLVDAKGRAVATANPLYRSAVNSIDYRTADWFRRAVALPSGDQYVADEVRHSRSQSGRQVLIYATAVRDQGQTHGTPLGALGVYFDWEVQGTAIVEDGTALTAGERTRTELMLIDGKDRVIAGSNRSRLFTQFKVGDPGKRGSYVDADGHLVAFARTRGYQEYDGQGWMGVIRQRLTD